MASNVGMQELWEYMVGEKQHERIRTVGTESSTKTPKQGWHTHRGLERPSPNMERKGKRRRERKEPRRGHKRDRGKMEANERTCMGKKGGAGTENE